MVRRAEPHHGPSVGALAFSVASTRSGGEVTVVLIIAHRLSTIKNVDRVYVMDEGRIVEEGAYHELRSRGQSRFRERVEMQRL